ncbi:MAG: hypothetical protein R3F59_11630 [Myxococcota bacterium]
MPRLIALDLGSHAVKGSLFQVNGRSGIELEHRFHRFVPQDGPSPSFEQRLAALDALLDDHPRSSRAGRTWSCWPGPAARPRSTDGDAVLGRAQIERALPFAVESEVPFELSDMVLSWRIAETEPQTQVMVALARRLRLGEWLAALAERGIDPPPSTSTPTCSGRAAAWSSTRRRPSLRGRHRGAGAAGRRHRRGPRAHDGERGARRRRAGGALHQRRRAHLHPGHRRGRPVRLGRGRAAQARRRGRRRGPGRRAERRRRRRPLRLRAPVARGPRRVDAAIGLLLAEIRSTLIKAEDTLGAEVVEVRLCGGSARIDELWQDLESDLGVPVRPALDPQGDEASGPFAVCQALALVSVSGSSPPIDLRVGEYAYRGRTDMLRAALGYGLSGAVFFCLAALLMFAWQYRSLMVEQTATEKAIRDIIVRTVPDAPESALDTLNKAEALLAGLTEDASQRADVLGDGSGGVPPTIDTLYWLTKAFPPHEDVQIEVSDMVISPGASISFNAETDGFQSSSKVVSALTSSPRFKGATKGQEQKLGNGHVRFPISIPLGEGAGEATETTDDAAAPANEEG